MINKIEFVVSYTLQNGGSISEDDFSKVEGMSSSDVFLAVKDAEQNGYFITPSGMGTDKKIWYLSPDGKLFARALQADK